MQLRMMSNEPESRLGPMSRLKKSSAKIDDVASICEVMTDIVAARIAQRIKPAMRGVKSDFTISTKTSSRFARGAAK